MSAPASGSQGRFGGELTFLQHLVRGFGVGGSGQRGEQRALARHRSVLGCSDPRLLSCCHSLTLGVSPSPRGAGGSLVGVGLGRNAGCAVFWGASLVAVRARGFGAPKFAVPPQLAVPAPWLPIREGDPPGGVWGASAGLGCGLRGCAQGECFWGALGCSRLGAGSALGVQAQGACLGCAVGVWHTRAASSGCDLRVLWGAASGCSLGLGAPAVNSRRFRGAGSEPGSSGRALAGARCPRVAVPPRMPVCFRKWLWHVAVLTGASGSPGAPAPERTKPSREGRPRGAGVQLGVPSLWEGLCCDILCQRCATVGTWVTCFPVAP